MKIYQSSKYQPSTGSHHPIVPDGTLIAWDESSVAVFLVQPADTDAGYAQVVCTKESDESYTGAQEGETYTFSALVAGTINAERTHVLVDTDTGTFTATEIRPDGE
jgi:hypothetical protein